MAGRPPRLWPRPEDYRYLEGIDRFGLAWEWLRRDPAYRQMTPATPRRTAEGLTVFDGAPRECVARWGCLNVEDPSCSAAQARLLWSASLMPSVLQMAARPARNPAFLFDLSYWTKSATLVLGEDGGEHVLLRLGNLSIRLDIMTGTLLQGPVTLRCELDCSDDCEAAIEALRLFLRSCRNGGHPTQSMARRLKTRRMIDALRVHDALLQGASIRDVGTMLFGEARVREEWSAPGEALKSHCRRLIALAREMVSGGYRQLLR
jgi:hypothetical protein